ncbi:MAG TPA: serine hydrolase [Acetobacteraceae bacterium]|nr:serine hydrolase [Acetobacteraceae bacterium]
MRGDYAHGRRGAGGAIVEVERASHDATQHSPVVPVVSTDWSSIPVVQSADFLLPCEGGSRFAILAAREQKSADTGASPWSSAVLCQLYALLPVMPGGRPIRFFPRQVPTRRLTAASRTTRTGLQPEKWFRSSWWELSRILIAFFRTTSCSEGRPRRFFARAPEELALTYHHEGMTQSLDEYLRRKAVTSLLIARHGTILYEHYQYDRTDADRFLSYSMAKTVTGMLIGIAVREGAIRSIDQLAADYVPELAGTEYGNTSIRNLLRMASGVAFRETYDGTDDATNLRLMQYRPGGPAGTRIVSMFNAREAPAGTRFHYASAETAVLGLVLRRAVDMPLADYLSTRVWQPMGAEADATWGVDNSGVETTQCCLSAVARDWLRFGLLLASDGVQDGREIIPQAWVLEATTPSAPFEAQGVAARTFGYGYQTWLLPGPRRQFMALGLHGQAIFVDPGTKLVLLHTAVWPAATSDTGLAELLALWRSLVEASAP